MIIKRRGTIRTMGKPVIQLMEVKFIDGIEYVKKEYFDAAIKELNKQNTEEEK